MNPITPDDLFSQDFLTRLDEIISKLETAMGTVTHRINDVKAAADKLAKTPIASNQAEETKKWANNVKVLSDEYKALLQEYGIYKDQISQVTTVQRDQNAILKLQEQYATSAEGSFNKLSAEYRLLKIAMNAMSTEGKENIKILEKMTKRAEELYSTMNEYQKSTGKYTMQVGDYSKALNGLQLSTQQIVREMPTLANSLSQFFMAISNNVPIFVDNFKRARVEMGSFTAALKGTLASLLSWQTALIVLLTVLPKIAKAIQAKKKAQAEANKETEKAFITEKNYISGMQKVAESETRAAVEAQTLLKISKDLTRSDEERAGALKRLNELYPDQSQNIEAYIKHLMAEAKAKAIVAQITELQIKLIQREFDLNAAIAEAERLKAEYLAAASKVGSKGNYVAQVKAAEKAQKAFQEASDNISKSIKDVPEIKQQIRNWQDQLGALMGDPFLMMKRGKGGGTTKEKQIGEVRDYTIALYDAILNGMEEGIEKAKLTRERDFWSIYSEYKKEYKQLEEQAKLAEEQKNTAVLEIIKEEMKKRKQAFLLEVKNLPTDKEIAQKYTEKTLSDPLLEVRTAYVEALNAMGRYAETIQKGLAEGRKIGQEELADWQEVIRKKIEAEAAYQKAKKDLELQGQRDAGQISQKEYEQLLEIYSRELDSKTRKALSKVGVAKSKRWNIWTVLFGKDVADESTGTITRVIGEDVKFALDQTANGYKKAIGYIDEYIDALQREAEQAIETARTEADLAKTVLEAELEAKANGYANSVDLARKEYEEKLALQEKAQKESEKIQKVQLAMESLSQAANLTTATTSIIASYAKLPGIGQALAIAAIAAMWGTFLTAKAKAMQVTKYGEGMSEYLDYGGSHASGNDIDFGVAKNGRRRRVERGEVIGVINKRRVSKYGASTVTGIIDSLNKGTFEYKYGNAFRGAVIASNGANLSHLENGVDALVRQGEYRETVANGRRIIQYKNLTRTTH